MSLIVGGCLLLVASTHAADYAFPISDPLKASLIPSGYRPLRGHYVTTALEIHPDRRDVPLLEGKNQVVLALFAQPRAAPLAFVIPGVGAHALTEGALMVAEQLHAMGLHAVTLPDPLSWQYGLGVSVSTLPGYLPADTREYYEFMKRVAEHLKVDHHLAIAGYSMVGYSYGGLLTAFLSQVDSQDRGFDFQRVVIICPPVDVPHAVTVVDGFYALGDGISDSRKQEISSAMVDVVIPLRNRPLTPEVVRWAAEQWTFTDPELKWLIGQAFRSAVVGTIFASRQMAEPRPLKPPAPPGGRSVRMNEAKQYSFRDYLARFVFPSIRRSGRTVLSDDEMLRQGSLDAVATALRANPRLFVMQNGDDFLVRPGDIEALRGWLGDRLYLYPRGGHMGNLWFDQNQADLRAILAPLVSARMLGEQRPGSGRPSTAVR